MEKDHMEVGHLIIAEKIIKQGNCDYIACLECPVNNLMQVDPSSTFCKCFSSDEEAILFFKEFIRMNNKNKKVI